MKIDEFTKEEKEFLLGNIAGLNIPLSHPEAEKGAALGRSVILKLEAALGLNKRPETEKKSQPLASASRRQPKKK